MRSNFHYVALKKPKAIDENTFRVGYVLDLRNNNKVLDVKVCRNLIRMTKQTFYLDSLSRNPDDFNDFCGEVSIDPEVFVKERYYEDKTYFITLLMHELGHCYDPNTMLQDENYSKIRNDYLKRGAVHPCELFADEFAIKERGLDRFLDAVDKMIFYRKQMQESEESKRIALLELELRKKHAIDYAKAH